MNIKEAKLSNALLHNQAVNYHIQVGFKFQGTKLSPTFTCLVSIAAFFSRLKGIGEPFT